MQVFQSLWSLIESLSDDDLSCPQDQRDVYSSLSWPELLTCNQFVFLNAVPNSCRVLLSFLRETLQDASDRNGLAVCLHSDNKLVNPQE